ncbi:MAG: phosphoenolpyruvate--protein phosphotransferase [Bryobacterales bacterium]|nr:phosphoenolpyruvate--protein phosphotransferase [Bryobacterales bacterium]
MIGLVVVSHSARLAEGVCELAGQMAQGKLRLAPAGGLADGALGTDAFRVREAIEAVYAEDGVLILMDLGSAVLSAETALELLDEGKRSRVRLCSAPLVEGAVAAAGLAAAGAGLEEILREAHAAHSAKTAQLGSPEEGPWEAEREVAVSNRLGLHARPAAQLVRLAREFAPGATVANLTRGAGPVPAGSITGLLGLGARHGDRLRIRAADPAAAAKLAAFIESGCGEAEQPPAPPAAAVRQPPEGHLAGIPASEGVAVGPLFRFRPPAAAVPARKAEDGKAEWERLAAAIRGAVEETRTLAAWATKNAGADEAGIFDAQALSLEDAELTTAVSAGVLQEGLSAEQALKRETDAFTARLRALDDPYLRARAADVADVAERVLLRLTGMSEAPAIPGEPCILSARDLAPSQVRDMDPRLVLGLCLESGSASSHSVILARATGIPAVVGLGPRLSGAADGTTVALDGAQGVVWISPTPEECTRIEERRRAWLRARREAEAIRDKPAVTRDGKRIRVVANISGVAEAKEAVESGAEGVGVLRTEFLFLGRPAAPTEQEQLAAYRAIAESLQRRPLIIRTLDVGGDKALPYLQAEPESNPFLGLRGLRLTLARTDLFLTQVRAILRTAAEFPVGLLLPMVSSVDELRQARALIREAGAALEREARDYAREIRAGVMIEVPAAAAVADRLAGEADFLSIGTNDLIQYIMAADRTNARVASIADPFQPAVLRTIRQVIEAGRSHGIEVGLCGELAAEPMASPLLLGFGLEEFSVSAHFIPGLKRALSRWSMAEAEALAREALDLDTSTAVRSLLADALRRAG